VTTNQNYTAQFIAGCGNACLKRGASKAEARTKVQALALWVIAGRIEHGEPIPFSPEHLFIEA
jgi:hypothetical protein